MGRCVKIIAAYAEAFWTGSFHISTYYGDKADIRDQGYAHNIFKSSVGSYPALVLLITGSYADTFILLDESSRKAAIFKQLSCMYSCELAVASDPVEYIEKDWCGDEYSSGCFAGILPVGALTTLKEHIYNGSFDGDIQWASTEIAAAHYGYMEGALIAGKSAAHGCLKSLGCFIESSL